MVAKVNPTTASVSVSEIKPRVSVQIVEPRLGNLTYQLPVAAIDYILIQVAAESDSSGRYQFKSDAVAVLDSTLLSIAKLVNDDGFSLNDAVVLEARKGLADTISMADVITVVLVFLRDFADTTTVAEAIALLTDKSLADTTSLADAETRSVSKGLSDGVALNDTADIEFDLQKYINNVVIPSDATILSSSKAVADTATITESTAFDLSRPLADSSTLTDAAALVNDLAKADTQTITDSLALDLAKTVTGDSISGTDAVSLTPELAASDSVSTATSGSLLSQGYCDITYFAEDYVGETRTFT